MLRFARGRRFDRALAHGSTDLPPACRVLGIPNTTMFDYEWASLQHHVNCRLATRVLVPDAIPADRLARYGARPPKLVQYPGLKEEYYLAGFDPDRSVLHTLDIDPAEILCVVRTAPSYALYLRGAENELLPKLLRRFSEQGNARTVVLARNDEQRHAIDGLGLERVTVPARAVDGRSLVALADLLVSAGGTMNREAAVLGTPVWSMFEGRLGAIDEMLARQGRLRMLTDPDQVVIEKKRRESGLEKPRNPAEMLALALELPS
jgi:predicted glycosyltransferase